MTKRARLQDIIKCCENRFNRGDATTWKHGDFVDLSREINRETDANISPNTLKRIFGKITVDEDYIPQQATLDALKKYGQYAAPENISPAQLPPAQPLSSQPDMPEHTSKVNWFRPMLLITIALVIGCIAWLMIKPKNITGKISLTRTEGQLPATAFFELQLPQTHDSLFVNFGDKSPLVYLAPGEKKTAHIYYIPGVFTVSVQTRLQAIATTSAYVSSGSWTALVFQNQQDIPNHFYAFPAAKTGSDSLFQVSNSQLFQMGLDTTGLILTRFCNYTPVAHDADDFVFEASFKNALQEKSSYCRGTQFQISGTNGMIRFKLVNPGCSLRILNVLSEQTFNGAKDDLSPFVVNLKQWNTVKLVNQHKQVSLYVNGKQIFSGGYQRPLGEVRGVFLELEGPGMVKNCELKALSGNPFYHF